ncbi:hypothetical protein PMZ80_000323 [Knufia obscura]|uniref:RRM domain-containing protein n=2 Tax=Knufia TaxID=430999 RepID=A0AAN8EJA1_9EURO|nr:hypothetical protein PMZ80_000323 [Knufia obscura]KAK5956748.1 hypothetical protein OHC33_002235 [Knufia fluminis]
MAYPPPPGHASLPPKPPPSAAPPKTNAFKPAFTAFAPRTVGPTGSANRSTSTAQYSAPPAPNYAAQPSYTAAPQPSYQAQPQYPPSYEAAAPGAPPQIRNPFVAAPDQPSGSNPYGSYDPEYEAQLQQWQSAYTAKDDKPGYTKTAAPVVKTETTAQGSKEAQKTVQRSGGGTTWTDDSLLEWDPAHFRIFVGNLAGEVTDESLLKAFAKYGSVQKARVIRDKRTTKSKGYGFVSFANGDEYFQAAKDMQGKYIGSHPVLIKRAMTEVRATTVKNDRGKHNKNKNKNKGAGGQGTVEYGGVEKKAPKTKNGLRVLG